MMDRAEFAARRSAAQADLIKILEPVVGQALDDKQGGSQTWWRQIVNAAQPLFDKIVREDGADPAHARAQWAHLSLDLAQSLTKTEHIDEYTHTLIATWVSSNILSYATEAAAAQGDGDYELEWVSMHDSKVRHTHRDADGQRVRPGHPFRVGTSSMRRPGDVSAPIKEWINCRCTLRAVPLHDNQSASVDTEPRHQGVQMNDLIQRATPTLYGASLVAALDAADDGSLIPWHGVLCVEGVWTGDRRRFQTGSLTHRDLPLPLTWQKESQPGHEGNVTVASIDWIEKVDDEWHAGGRIMPTPEADEMVGLLAHFGKFGVSIDADMAEMSFVEYDGGRGGADTDEMPGQDFTAGRICGACVVGIGAVAEAWVTLGEREENSLAASIEQLTLGTTFVSEKPWNGSASRFTPEQWKASCILHTCDGLEKSCHHLPIKEPGGQLSRAGVHAAASRINQTKASTTQKAAAKRALRSAYKSLGEDPPEGLSHFPHGLVASIEDIGLDVADDELCLHDGCTNPPTKVVSTDHPDIFACYCDDHAVEHEDQAFSAETFGRGPGWITNPEDTRRIHDYWTKGKGAAKIAWGTPGDFNRCRVEVGEEIGENSPDKLRFLNQICAQWHKDATGFWPGHAPTEQASGDPVPSLAIVASTDTVVAPSEWFTDPGFTKKTHFTMEEVDGLWHVFGHVADWGTCHMGFNAPGQCVTVGPSTNGYAYYLQGEVLTTEGPVATGPLTLATGHAGRRLGMRPALAHYDNTGTAVADVVCGDDEFGIWVNGWVRPWMSAEKIYELRAHPPSIDLRRNPNTGEYDLIAILSVNAPGLPVLSAGIENGVQMSIIASLGADDDEPEVDPIEGIAEALAAALERRENERREIEALTLEEA